MDRMMNAVSIDAFGDAESLRIRRVPGPTLKANEVLIRNRAIGVNFVDVQHRSGHPYPIELPLILGIEAAGEVIDVGKEVRTVAVGQRVAVAGHMVGIYAEYFACPEELTIPLPETVDYEQAASSLLQGMTAHALSHEAYPIRAGDTVLIQAAAGGVGLLLTQIAKMRGATVIGTCSTEEKAIAVRAAGGDETILYTQTDVVEEVARITAGVGVHAVFDAVGRTTFDAGLEALRAGGHMVVYGLASGNVAPFDINRLSGIAGYSSRGSLSLTWASLSTYNDDREVMLQRAATVLDWVAAGDVSVTVAGRFPLRDARDAHGLLERRDSIGKILLIP